jgi:penicillin amidase
LLGIAVVALLLILGGAGFAYWSVQKTLPTINGTASLPGLSAPVTVTRDQYGVPHIMAANVSDLYAAQGYVHAQDRLFQMFYYRQVGAGKLAEAFGERAVYPDTFLRTVGLRRSAEAEWQQTSPEVKTALEAYALGVNAFLHSHQDGLPLEFSLIGVKPEDWQPVDTVAFGKVMAWDLSGNWDQELVMGALRDKLGAERAAQLFPSYPGEGPFVVPGANSGDLAPALSAFNQGVRPWLPGLGIEGLGSNNWVVDGTKSATGKPLLSNDPHLGVQNPSIWYQVHLSTTDGKYDAVGFGFAGVPGVVAGHNQNIAWGVTNGSTDVQDLFVEKLDEAGHPGQFQSASGWKPMQTTTEVIKVKDGEPVTRTIRFTDHGPLLSDALTAISSTLVTSPTEALSFQWTASHPGHIIESVYGLQQAANWQEFRAALSKWSVPGQNFVYADKQGNIGYQMTGEQPIRKKGDGKSPAPGWTGEYDWSGYVPFDDLPRSYNPPEHYVATANNKQFGADYKYPIEGYWSAPWRISRIVEMLKAKDKIDAGYYKEMLMDTHSPVAKKVGPVLAGLKPAEASAQSAMQLFKGWDGDVRADSAAAGLYEVTLVNAISDTLRDDLGDDLFGNYLGTAAGPALRMVELMIDKPDDPFWDRTDTAAKEKRDDILLRALNEGVASLTTGIGPEPQEWTWGKLHTITPRHTFSGQPVISGIFTLESLPFGGDQTTVSVGPYELLQPFEMTSHQSYRMIVDTGDWSKSLAIYAGGQSGQPYAKHWGDQYPLWQRGDYNPMLYAKQDVQGSQEGVLTLNP